MPGSGATRPNDADDPASAPLPERLWHAPWLWMALVVALFCVPLFVGLGRADYENDEAIYTFGVDVMLKTGDWLTPRLIPNETEAFLEKPPLKFWIVGLPIHWGLLPANEFGMRFWDALMGSVAFLYVFAIGRRLAGPICGVTAVLLLFAHAPLILEHGLRTNNMEAAVFLAYAGGIYHFLAWRTSGPGDRGHVLAMGLYFVLGFMTKDVAVLFLPAVLTVTVMLRAEDRQRLRLEWTSFALAGGLAAALIAPWFVYEYVTRGREVFDTMFSVHVMERFRAFLDPAHVRPWHFYATELWRQLQASGAGALTVAGAAMLLYRTARRRWVEGALVVLWFAMPVGLISLGTSKLYHYLYPFLPPVALAGGYAAAIVVRWLWRMLRLPAHELADLRRQLLPRWSIVAAALTVLGVAALALAVATAFLGRVHLAVGGVELFRNSSIVRPFAAGAVMLWLGGSAGAVRAIVPLAAWLALMPFGAYTANVALAHRDYHPLQDLRACLSGVVAQVEAAGRPRPGVWAEGVGFFHQYSYYLYGLGPWQQRDLASDMTVAKHLFTPREYRPVVLSMPRYEEFTARLGSNASELLDRAAARFGLEPAVLAEDFRRDTVRIVHWNGAALLLPGPYAACAASSASSR
jgi:4-amino-4-deoxy-L-arabinose transferase-like glycosyltransferase